MARFSRFSLATVLLAQLAFVSGAAAQTAPAETAAKPPTESPKAEATPAPEEKAESAAPKEEAGEAEASEKPAEEPAEEPAKTEEAAPPAEEEKVAEEATPPPPAYDDDYAETASTEKLVPKKKKQSSFILGLLWDTSLPLGITSDFAGKFSARGFSVDGRYRGLGNIGLGVTLAWHVIDEKTTSTTKWGSATITGTQVREISSSPFTFKVSYALRDQKKFIPYVGIGIGAARVLRRIDMGISRVTEESWHFAMVPELGVEIPTKAVVLLASTRFNYFVKTGDDPAQLYMNFSLGVGFD